MQAFGYSLAEAHGALAEVKNHASGFVATAPSPALATWAGG